MNNVLIIEDDKEICVMKKTIWKSTIIKSSSHLLVQMRLNA